MGNPMGQCEGEKKITHKHPNNKSLITITFCLGFRLSRQTIGVVSVNIVKLISRFATPFQRQKSHRIHTHLAPSIVRSQKAGTVFTLEY